MAAMSGVDSAARVAMYGANRLKIGVFGSNCSSGIAATKVPERWSGSWEDNVRLAGMLDESGIDFILPVGRWRSFGGETNFEAATFETVTWATALLAQTKHITIFGTVHAPLVHPVYAAKQFVTADHAGCGRFGLNVVCGWNQDEFDMFGAEQRLHDDRYAYGAEWLEVVRRLWHDEEPFDFSGRFFALKSVQGLPKPFGDCDPIVMNAGASPAGVAFALDNADCLFTRLYTIEDATAAVRELKRRAAELGRAVGVYTSVNVVCRPTDAEALEYYRYFADEMADWGALRRRETIGNKHQYRSEQIDIYRNDRVRQAAGYGGFPCVGSPDTVAKGLGRISETGFDGVAVGLVNYLDEFPYLRDEVLPRLARAGLRTALT